MSIILLVGSSGTLGQALNESFNAQHRLIISGHQSLDITDPAAVYKEIKALKPDWVVNASAYNAVDLIETDETARRQAFAVNAYGVQNLAMVCKRYDIPFVHFSTNYVFDGTQQTGYKEDDIPCPLNQYGKSKLLGEMLLKATAPQHYLIRLSTLFGKRGTSEHSKRSFVDLMLSYALEGKNEQMKLVSDEWSAPIYAPDLACALLSMIESHPPPPFGTYHVINDGSCTPYTLAQKIFEMKQILVKGMPISACDFNKPAKRPRLGVLLNTKLPLLRPWQEALAEYLSSVDDMKGRGYMMSLQEGKARTEFL